MSEKKEPENHNHAQDIQHHFAEDIEMEACGYSFCPIEGFELEVDGSVYMYSKDGNVEISMMGGELSEETSIAELNNRLAENFMANVGDFELIESGTDAINEITGFLNEIRFSNVDEEEGQGYALICSPFFNQYFFILVIASAQYWKNQGWNLFEAVKSHIHFHPQFKSDLVERKSEKHPDLTIETYKTLMPEEDLVLTIEKSDISLLLAARSEDPAEEVCITEIVAPDQTQLYHYNPNSDEFSNPISKKPLIGQHGEVCFFFPRTTNSSLHAGDYKFSFATKGGAKLEEVQIIIRAGRALNLQNFNLNFWLAVENGRFSDPDFIEQFEAEVYQALKTRLAPFNLSPGKISSVHPALDELKTFSSLNLDTDLADCSYMISESISDSRALNVGLFDNFVQGSPPTQTEISALTAGSPGMILSSASPHACIVIKWPAYETNFDRFAEEIIQQLILFSGIDLEDTQAPETQTILINKEVAWRLRRHPIFYPAG